jgi:hypothetical protein
MVLRCGSNEKGAYMKIHRGSVRLGVAGWGLLLLTASGCGLQRSADQSNGSQSRQSSRHPGTELSSPDTTSGSSIGTKDEFGTLAAAGNAAGEYSLDRPDLQLTLPAILREISDVAVLSDSEVACVQDERGIVFVYNIKTRQITDEVRFASKGDYEGLAVVDSKLFILRSDGQLFELSSLKRHPSVQTYDLHLPARESEGLCFDAAHQRLLIAPKSHEQTEKGEEIQPIFGFDLRSRTLAPQPVFQIRVRDIRHFAKAHDLPVPRRPKKDGSSTHAVLHFLPSALGVHPVTGEVFVLSSGDHVLVSCNEFGQVTGYALLDANLFRQPEGIAFFANGDMVVTNEAGGKEATLLVFHWKQRGH